MLDVLLVPSMSKKLGLAAELVEGEATLAGAGETAAPGADWKSSKSSAAAHGVSFDVARLVRGED